jgi:SAM-dependent methyltransferase
MDDNEVQFPDFSVFYNNPANRITDEELDRQTVEHYAFKLSKGRNFLAPIEDILIDGNACCIDIGTGMGIWVMEMSSDFPESTFIGVDKIETFPTGVYPKNADFRIMDATKPWPYEDGVFDLVLQRMLFKDLKTEDWPFVLKEAYRCLKPGGWIQYAETHLTTSRASDLTVKLCHWVIDVIATTGCDGLIFEKLPQLIIDAGFQEIQEYVVSIPFGAWGGAVGTLLKDDAGAWSDTFKQAVVGLLGVSPEEYDEAHHAMMTDCETLKSYTQFSVFIAQKPLCPSSNEK